jgi:MFS family permease
METTKPVASNGMRFLVAALGLLASGFLIAGISYPENFLSIFGVMFAVDNLNIQSSTVGVMMIIARICLFCLLPVFGLLGDRFGRRKFIIAGLILAGLAICLLGLASTALLYGLAVIGLQIGIAMATACLLAFMLEAVSSRWFLSYAAASYLGGMLIGGMFSALFGGRWMDLYGRGPAAFLLIGATAATGLLFGGVLMLIVLLIRKKYQWPEDWLDRPPDRRRGFRFGLLLAVVFLVAGLGSLYTTYYFYYYGQVELKSMSASAVLSSAYGLSYLIGIVLSGILADLCNWLVERFAKKTLGRPAVLVTGLLVSCLGLLLMLRINPDTTAVSMLPRVILIAFGLGFCLPALVGLLVEQFPHRRWGLIAGLYLAVNLLGGTAIQAVGSALVTASGYLPGSSLQPAPVHALLTTSMPVMALILTGIALVIGMLVLALGNRPVVEPSLQPGTPVQEP